MYRFKKYYFGCVSIYTEVQLIFHILFTIFLTLLSNLPLHLSPCRIHEPVIKLRHSIRTLYRDPSDVTKGQDCRPVCPIVLPSLMPGLITLAARRTLSVCLCADICVCTLTTDSLSTCGPPLPAGSRSSTETEMQSWLLPSDKPCSPFNLESLTVET